MSAYGLIQSLGEDVTYYARTIGSRDSETNHPAITWDGGTTTRALIYKLYGRVEDRGDTKGVYEQRYMVLTSSALLRGNKFTRGGVTYVIDSDASPHVIMGETVAYSCEAVLARLM